MNKICVIGHFGFGKNLLNGQTIKTKIVTAEIENKFGKENVILLDLAGGVKKIPSLIVEISKVLRKCDNVVILPVENGLKFLTPVLGFWNTFYKKKLHYVVIGGWLPEFLSKRKCLRQGLKKFYGIYVETNTMKLALEKQGLNNLFVLPNCKNLKILSEDKLVYPVSVPYRLCTFSRVMKEKGIEDAINAVEIINTELGYHAYSLDIYGQIWDEYKEYFNKLIDNFPTYIRYCGAVDADKSVDVLKNYFALLFPTYYEGEGFAGTLIDAYSAGVPVIATDWRYNTELVTDAVGFTYHTGNQLEFIELLRAIAVNPNIVLNKKIACIKEANKYNIDTALKILMNNF